MLIFKHIKDCAEVVYDTNNKHAANGSTNEVAVLPTNITKRELLDAYVEFEQKARTAIVEGLTIPSNQLHRHPLHTMNGNKSEKQYNNEKPIGQVYSVQNTNVPKLMYVAGLVTCVYDWLFEKNKLPKIKLKLDKTGYVRRLRREVHGTCVADVVANLSIEEFRELIEDLFVDRMIPATEMFTAYIQYDFEGLYARLEELDDGIINFEDLTWIDDEICIADNKKSNGITPMSRAWALFLMSQGNKFWLLPMGHIFNKTSTRFQVAIAPRMGSTFYKVIIPENKWKEVLGVAQILQDEVEAGTHVQRRVLQTRHMYHLFACSSYGSTNGFDIDALDVVRSTLASKLNYGQHGIVTFGKKLVEYYDLDHDKKVEAIAALDTKASKTVLAEDPFALFKLNYNEVVTILKTHVINFKKVTGYDFPKDRPKELFKWVFFFETALGEIKRKNYSHNISAAKSWMRYLIVRHIKGYDVPSSFADVKRQAHIHDLKNNDTFTFKKYLSGYKEHHQVEFKAMSQFWHVWEHANQSGKTCPIQSQIDYSHNTKKGRTSRRSIPSLIVETLIEENAAPCEDGMPYAFQRTILNGNTHNMILCRVSRKVDGEIKTADYPLAAGVLDCVLNLGMRSSGARWLCTGQDDQYHVDVNTLTHIENKNGIKNQRQGGIQLMQVGPDTSVLSLLMMKDKVNEFYEIPYLPKELAKRLEWLKGVQDEYNPIESPIRATDQKDKFSIEAATTFVYPLFRDPSSVGNAAITRTKVAAYWEHLLRHCEPIIHAKRCEIYGDDTEYYHFFDKLGKPVWDIHSIRVAVVTNLLEQGVPPTIVQLLVGHKSPLMTLHYEAIDNAKTHEAIAAAFEERRKQAIHAIGNASSQEEAEEAIENLLGGLAQSDANPNEALEIMSEQFGKFEKLKDIPSGMSVFSHGICPGADCSKGAVGSAQNKFMPVHRPKACSRCRYRVTGPAFLAGLVLNANILIAEIQASSEKEKELIAELNDLEDAELPTGLIESRINQEQAFRDELYADWAAEITTIQNCRDLLNKSNEDIDKSVPVVPDINFSFVEKHNVTMMTAICENAQIIAGASADIPSGLRERRDSVLFDIMAQNNAANYLLKLNKSERSKAFDEFGKMLSNIEDTTPNGADHIEKLVNGEERLTAIDDNQNPDDINLLEAS